LWRHAASLMVAPNTAAAVGPCVANKYLLFREGEILGEILRNALLSQHQEIVLDRLDFWAYGCRGEILRGSTQRFTSVRTKCGNVNQTGDLGMGACLADDGAAVGMSYENNRTVLRIDDPLGCGDVVREAAQWILHRDDMQSTLLEHGDDLCPAAAVRPGTMHEDDVLDGICRHRGASGNGHCACRGQPGNRGSTNVHDSYLL
jgi:hypothetical protein